MAEKEFEYPDPTFGWDVALNGGIHRVWADSFETTAAGGLLFWRISTSGRVLVEGYAAGNWKGFHQIVDKT